MSCLFKWIKSRSCITGANDRDHYELSENCMTGRSISLSQHHNSGTSALAVSANHHLNAASKEMLYCKLITEGAYQEIQGNPFGELHNIYRIHLEDFNDRLVQKALVTVEVHDIFSIIKSFLQTLKIPCILICRVCDNSITGLEPLVMGSSVPINWLHMMLTNDTTMTEYFKYGGLHFIGDGNTAVITPREHHVLPVPQSTPHGVPRTQLQVSPPHIRPISWNQTPIYDSDDEVYLRKPATKRITASMNRLSRD